MSTDTIARHRRLLNGIPSQPDFSAPLPKRILTNPWTWIGVVLTGIYAACLWSQYALMTADTPVRDGVVPGINHSAIRDAFWFALPTLIFWIVVFVIADRFRPQRLLLWYLTLGWGACVATFLALHINTWASEQLSIGGDGDPTTGARAAIYIAPFVEEAAKATVLFGVALLARYQLVTKLNGVALADPAGGVGRQLVFDVGNIPGNTVQELTYYVRLGVGSQQGDGVNRATAVFPGARGLPIRSNTALFKVNVQGGVFSNEGCIVGKVFLDCDGNSAQGNDGGSRELGIPGVRLVMLDGSYVVTDSEGKYSLCGVKPQTHVIKVDRTTLPAGSRLLPSSNRNAAVGSSLIVDMKGGELARADFIEGSCSVEVLEQVKARRAQGGVAVPETKAQPQAGGVK